MEPQRLEQAMEARLKEDNHRETIHGEYHPSTVTGCALKAVLDRMTEEDVELNSYMFAGTAVHYFLQESGILTDALYDAGYHPVHTAYEVSKRKELGDGITITGTCDAICDDGDNMAIIDLKYSSLKPEYNHGRVAKYFAQVNTYAHLFNADEMALFLISSNERDNLPEKGLNVLTGTPAEDNWEITKEKVRWIHKTLTELGYPEGERATNSWFESADMDFWRDLLADINLDYIPSYDEECKYCSHSEYCPVKQGKMGGGTTGVVNKVKNGE